MDHRYAAYYTSLIASYEARGELGVAEWDDIRRILLEHMVAWLQLKPWDGGRLDVRLVSRIGADWYKPRRVEDVARLLDGV